MVGEIDWRFVEDSSPENRELGEVIRRLEGADYEISDDAFLNFESRILLTDAAPRNVRIVCGTPALFDVIATVASEKVHA